MKSWHQRIEEAKFNNKFTNGDRALAESWIDCACGEQDPRIPRDIDGIPRDSELYRLGAEFNVAVQLNEVAYAKDLLTAIEKRAVHILKKLGHIQ